MIRKIFDEYDVNGNLYLSSYDLNIMLNKLELKSAGNVVEGVH